MRDCSIETIDNPEGNFQGSGWKDVVQDRPVLSITTCEFELAEEVIALIRYADSSFEVGIGESLRPYHLIYLGPDEKEAEDGFWQSVTHHVRNM